MSQIWDNGPERQSDRFVLLALADYANDEGECWPAIAGIVRKTCMSERGVQSVLRRLEADGWLVVNIGAAKRGCNQYTVRTPERRAPPQELPPAGAAPHPRRSCTPTPAGAAPEPSFNHHLTISDGDAPISSPPPHEKKDAGEVKPKRATRLLKANEDPMQWQLPKAWGEWAASEGWQRSAILDEAKRFADYWASAGGKNASKLDWFGTWRNWMRNSKAPRTAPISVQSQGSEHAAIASLIRKNLWQTLPLVKIRSAIEAGAITREECLEKGVRL